MRPDQRRVCLITGGSGPLGTALCRALSPEYSVVTTYRNRLPTFSSNEIRHLGNSPLDAAVPLSHDEVFAVRADLSQRSDVARLVELCLARFDRIDCVVNSAADTHFHGKILELWQSNDYPAEQLWMNAVVPIQLVSLIFDECWKDHVDQNERFNRNVVNVSSVSGASVARDIGQSFYGASKAALNYLTLCLANELAPYLVRANAVCPSRFSERSLAAVVQRIRNLLSGDETGTLS